MIVHHFKCVKCDISKHTFLPYPTDLTGLSGYILCDVTYNDEPVKPKLSPGQLVYKKSKERLDRLQFYVDSLAGFERSYLAARYLRRVSPHYQRILLRDLSISDLAFNEVFCKENYGW